MEKRSSGRVATATIHSENRDGTYNVFVNGVFHPSLHLGSNKRGSFRVFIEKNGQIRSLD